jgi:hypothetical protein
MQKTLKTVMWWVVGTVATVPLTKLVESYFDVSFFTPAIMKLFGWVQSAWGWLGNDVSLPVWVTLLLCLTSLLSLVFLGFFVYANWFEEGEETPEGAPLTDDQQKVFVVIGKAFQDGHNVDSDGIRRFSGLSRIATQNAIDHLYRVGLIRPVRNLYGAHYADLTPKGRDYYLELERENGWGEAR